jgi:hypothetical protein
MMTYLTNSQMGHLNKLEKNDIFDQVGQIKKNILVQDGQ